MKIVFYLQGEEVYELDLPDNIKSISLREHPSKVYSNIEGIRFPSIEKIEFYESKTS